LTIFLLGAGNLLSIHQAMLFVIYAVASIPAGLAYLARWAFDREFAFFGVLAFDAVVAIIVYRIALNSAVDAAERLKKSMIAALSSSEGPIAG
jgi:ABC-2 type transport system permease protein